MQDLAPLLLEGRCHRCFHVQCLCHIIDPQWDYAAAACELTGPIRSLLNYFKERNSGFLAQACASYMYLQHGALGWPLPDCIVPVPQSLLGTIQRGYNPNTLLAKELASLMRRPPQHLLKRRVGGIRQTACTTLQRLQLPSNLFIAKKREKIENKVILLIDDVFATGTTLNRCAEVLIENGAQVYVMTFALCEYTAMELAELGLIRN